MSARRLHRGKAFSWYRNALAWDKRVTRLWQRVPMTPWSGRALLSLVWLGDGWVWLLFALFLAWLLPGERVIALVGQGLTAAVVSLMFYWGVKAAIRRSRPHTLSRRIVPRVLPRDLYSFPSGHTMNNLAIGVSLAAHVPALWPIVLLAPLLIGLLRVMAGVHFILDVVAGAVFGLLSGAAAVGLYALLR
jgi:undecaprenyl-diphosphatase